MSTLYLATDVEALANRLARNLDQSARTSDFFAPTTVVVTHRSVSRWLKLWLARNHGIAINLDLLFFESSLWKMLKEVDPRPQEPEPELLDEQSYRLLVLSILLENRDPHLELWSNYLQRSSQASRLFCRRIWQLSDQLAHLVRDYEYHRQDTLIQHWLKGDLGLGEDHARLERAQQAIFAAITREPDGKRAKLNCAWQRNFKTLPQYAMEVMEHFELNKIPPPPTPYRAVHLFGLAQFSTLHAKTLCWLGRFFDLHLYHFNPLAGRLPQRPGRPALQRLARSICADTIVAEATGGLELLHAWSRAAESLHTMAQLLDGRSFRPELLPTTPRENSDGTLFAGPGPTVLARLQDHLLQGSTPQSAPIPQDRSLQIVACPGMIREVETVYNSILANLQETPDLKQSDVAVLVTDMDRYRPLLQSVFERQPPRLRYNLGEFTAAGVSTLAQAVLGMLDLALDAFTRSQVFAVLLNPCFLTRLGIDRSQALVWLDWAEALSIHQGWDQADKKERGYPDSPLFAWQLGLQRLRLGRIMDVEPQADSALPRFGPVIPYADLNSDNPEQLDAFCLAVEGLLPRLAKLRSTREPASRWVALLESLIKDFLQVPDDRPEEAHVWDRLVRALQKWLLWDHLGDEPQRLPLAVIREMVQSLFEEIEGRQGEFLTGGVTVAALSLFKPIPFRIVYVLGLCEDIFPGNNALSGLDLRSVQRLPGDIRPAEYNLSLLLEAVLSARDKLYLVYQNLNPQKDQILHPGVPLQQLKRYLKEHITAQDFEEGEVPLLPCDERYLQPCSSTCDALVQFGELDRLLAVEAGQRAGLELSPEQQAEYGTSRAKQQGDFSLREDSVLLSRPVPTLRLRDLARYLEFPVPAALKYHLRIEDDRDEEPSDDEPFVTDRRTANKLFRDALEYLVLSAVRSDLPQALKEWPDRFARVYEEWGLCGELPEDAFGEVDRVALQEDLSERIVGEGGLAEFLSRRPGRTFCGPILLGETPNPIGARQRFPALNLALSRPLPQLQGTQVRLVGTAGLAWRDDEAFEILTWSFRKDRPKENDFRDILEPVLFYLALRAGTGAPVDSRAWLGERVFRAHIAHASGITSFEYSPAVISPEVARSYLANLATDFLDAACFDLLPLDDIFENKELKPAFTLPDEELGSLPQSFRDLLEDLLDEDQPTFRRRRVSALDKLVEAKVPEDAFEKVRRRFRLLAMGVCGERL